MELIELLEKIVSDYHNSQNIGDVNNSQNTGDVNNSQNTEDINTSQNTGNVNNSQNTPNIDEKIAGIENQLKSIFNLIQERNINTPVTHNNPDNISDVYRNLVNRRNKEDK